MKTLRTVLAPLFEDGLKIDAEDHGSSQHPNLPVGTHQSAQYTTVWTFTIRYGGRQDTFEYTLPGKPDPVPSIHDLFDYLFDDTAFEYDNGDFGTWAMDNDFNTAIEDSKMTIKDVWDRWQASQEMKKRLVEIFTLDVFLDILQCDKTEYDEEGE